MQNVINTSFRAVILSLLIIACQRRTVATGQHQFTNQDQPIPVSLSYQDPTGNLQLLGKNDRQHLASPPFDTWFQKNYNDYTIDTPAANRLKPLLKNKKFIIFMGTWCGDSKREVPRMYKLLDYCGVKPGQVQLVNVSNVDSLYKQSPTHEERGLFISRVPDLLVYEKQSEIGRIVESPVASLEKDLLSIASKTGYQPCYPGTAHLIGIFQSPGWLSTPANLEQAAEQLRPLVSYWGELTSFGRVLLATGDTERAIAAMRISTLLYPAEPGTYNYLAAAYVKKGNTPAARQCCEKVLQLQPGNQQALTLLAQLNKQ